MYLKKILTLVVLLTSLSTSVAMAAPVPTNVKDVQVQQNGETVTVLWSPVSGAVRYRIYFSHESILGNAGNYDDFEETPDAEPVYIFVSPPLKTERIYFTVLAVDKDDVESEGFETEAVVTPKEKPEPATVPAVAPPATKVSSTSTEVPMRIEEVLAASATGVLVTFSKEIAKNAELNPSFFVLTTASGTMLSIVRVDVSGEVVLLTTEAQTPDTEYVFGLLVPVPAVDGTNATPSDPQVRFTSLPEEHGEVRQELSYGKNPNLPTGMIPSFKEYEPAKNTPQNPSDLDLSAVPRRDGTYNVIARWVGSPSAEQYVLSTSKDFAPYSPGTTVGSSETSAEYHGVTPGVFGVKIASRIDAAESSGIERVITLPATGVGLLGIMAIAGISAFRRVQRRGERDLV